MRRRTAPASCCTRTRASRRPPSPRGRDRRASPNCRSTTGCPRAARVPARGRAGRDRSARPRAAVRARAVPGAARSPHRIASSAPRTGSRGLHSHARTSQARVRRRAVRRKAGRWPRASSRAARARAGRRVRRSWRGSCRPSARSRWQAPWVRRATASERRDGRWHRRRRSRTRALCRRRLAGARARPAPHRTASEAGGHPSSTGQCSQARATRRARSWPGTRSRWSRRWPSARPP